MKVLLVGSGAREHALAWRLAQQPGLSALHAAPGNPGIAALAQCHPVRTDDADGLVDLAGTVGAELVVIGPEAPLDRRRRRRAPPQRLRRLRPERRGRPDRGVEGVRQGRPARGRRPDGEAACVAEPPCVVKADGLAAGKGVFVCRSQAEVDEGLSAAAALGGEVIVEELLEGDEVSLFALADGRSVVPLGAAQDFKRIGDGDVGPNTGGMGAYAPVPWLQELRHLDRTGAPARAR